MVLAEDVVLYARGEADFSDDGKCFFMRRNSNVSKVFFTQEARNEGKKIFTTLTSSSPRSSLD